VKRVEIVKKSFDFLSFFLYDYLMKAISVSEANSLRVVSKRRYIVRAVLLLFIFALVASATASANTRFKTGDYIQFASYNTQPVLWRVISVDANGAPLLLAEHILTYKSFDARGGKYTNEDRRDFGSNDWSESTLRQWLNSAEPKIAWANNVPALNTVLDGYNPYDTEKGFLVEGNFSEQERALIRPTANRIPLAKIDEALAQRTKQGAADGTGFHQYAEDIEKAVANYDKAFYRTVTDRVFLPSVKQIKNMVQARGWEYRAKPTKYAVLNSTYRHADFESYQFDWYWLSTPWVDHHHSLRVVDPLGQISNEMANNGVVGVRPALSIHPCEAAVKAGGLGSLSKPYIIDGSENAPARLAAGNAVCAFGSTLYVNGKPYVKGKDYLIRNGTIMVPYKTFFAQAGLKAAVQKQTKKTPLTVVGTKTMPVFNKKPVKLELVFKAGSKVAKVNGKDAKLSAAPFRQGRAATDLWVPLKLVAQQSGMKWYMK
jgi:hypothetical protein